MAKYVHEIMNPELFAVEPDAPRADALDFVLALGITACPVIDEAGALKGITTIRDLMSDTGGNFARDRISAPAVTVGRDDTVEAAARKLAEERVHRLVALDDKGRAVGMVSAVDLVAALTGVPVAHPTGFPHVDSVARLSWSNDRVLEPEQTGDLPDAAGVVVLIYGGAGRQETPVWIEAARDLRARLDDLLVSPQDEPQLAHLLERDRGHLRFRVAVVEDAAQRDKAVAALRRHEQQRARLLG
ncbi:MAG: CBS domain-containing protein [Myxococcales bacterium]|jgi:CBS domain-containing protein